MNVARKKNRKKRTIRILVTAAVVIAILAAAVLLLKDRVAQEYGSASNSEIQTATVSVGSISTTVSGSGNLADEDIEAIEILSSVEIEEICVSVGEAVKEGDLLAKVDMPSVISSMSDLQDALDSLDDEIGRAAGDAVSSSIKANVSGRVKAIYAAEGDDVATVMYENGALAVMSLDGYMAVDLETEGLEAGDVVSVESADGTRYEGSVSQAVGDQATVLITDNGTAIGGTVTVYDSEGNAIGAGTLYIHEPLKITGYAGTVSEIYVSENSSVSAGKKLFYLTETGYSANYESLLRERAKLEDELNKLLVVYKEGAVYAEMSGSVSSIAEEATSNVEATSTSIGAVSSSTMTLDSTQSSTDMQTILSICPGKTVTVSVSVDESSILSLEVGQEASVSVDALGDETFFGTVTEIDTTGSTSGGVTLYTAVITLDKAERMLAGMSASVTIKIEGVENALLIPSDALTQTSSSSYVYTSYNAQTGELGGMIEVATGLNNGSSVEITGGLSEGDTIYYIEPEDEGFRFGGGMPGGMNFGGGGMPEGMDFNAGNLPGGGTPRGN